MTVGKGMKNGMDVVESVLFCRKVVVYFDWKRIFLVLSLPCELSRIGLPMTECSVLTQGQESHKHMLKNSLLL